MTDDEAAQCYDALHAQWLETAQEVERVEALYPEAARHLDAVLADARLAALREEMRALEAEAARARDAQSVAHDRMAVIWHQRGELAALRGTPPPVLGPPDPRDVAAVIGRVTTLHRAGPGYLVGGCPLCGAAVPALHVYPADHVWGCAACGAFGDAADWINAYRALPTIEG